MEVFKICEGIPDVVLGVEAQLIEKTITTINIGYRIHAAKSILTLQTIEFAPEALPNKR